MPAPATPTAAELPTYNVLGVLIQFLATPEQVNDPITVMRGTIPPGVFVPLHTHADPEIFYVLDGALEVFQSEGPNAGWQTIKAGETITIPGNIRHALRNTAAVPTTSITVTRQELYNFFRELAQPFDPSARPAPPTPEAMQHLFQLAVKYRFWMASPEANAAIGIQLG